MGVLENALPNAIGGLTVLIIASVATYLVTRYRKSRVNAFGYHKELLPPEDAALFVAKESSVSTNDDRAGLALIAAIIDHYAESKIQVVGRGSQWVDPNTSVYMRAVARAIIRGVAYCRILILDRELPSNGLAWMMLLERFLNLARYRGKTSLHAIHVPQSKGLTAQFQLVDDRFLHRTNRYYSAEELGANQTSFSFFAVSPHPEVANHVATYNQHLQGLPAPLTHNGVVEQIQEMLTCFDDQKYSVIYHWKLVLDTIEFIDNLDVEEMPPRAVRFVGALMPHTYTYEAANRFVAEKAPGEEARARIVLPFESLKDCINEFVRGRLDYLCLPSENSTIGEVVPPAVSLHTLEGLFAAYAQVYKCDITISLCLAGRHKKLSESKRLVSVGVAFEQVINVLPKSVLAMPRQDSGVMSNYHAAWMALQEYATLAITTLSAAEALGLHVLKNLEVQNTNETRFIVLEQRRN